MQHHYFLLLVFTPVTTASYYTQYNLEESEHLCETLHSKPLQLGANTESAIRLLLYGKKSFHCQFEIQPHGEKYGIVAVIQDMKFRTDLGTGECVDYIMFKGSKFGGASKKYCGNYDVEIAMEKYVYQGATYIAMSVQNAYQNAADDGVVVIIHMNMNDDDYYDAGAELVLTSYTDCRANAPWFYKPCVPKNLDTICIEDIYFGDGIVNCPFKGCVDEGSCVPLLVKYYGKRIFAGALMAVVLSLCLSAACFYLCTPMKTETTPPLEMPQNYMLPPLDDETNGENDNNVPYQENTDEDSEENWDKPPMYESLFPEVQSPFTHA